MTIAFVNNEISYKVLLGVLKTKQLEIKTVALFVLRPNKSIDESKFKEVVAFDKKNNSYSFGDYIKAPLSFVRGFRRLKKLLLSNEVIEVFIVNNDNLLTNYVIRKTKQYGYAVSVLSEGIMNYQNISIENRNKVSLAAKGLFSLFFGFIYEIPKGHLSGSEDKRVKWVYAFSQDGLKAPKEKIVVINAFETGLERQTRNELLIVLSGLFEIMSSTDYYEIVKKMKDFIDNSSFKRILIKEHPRVENDPILKHIHFDEILPKHEAVESVIQRIGVSCVVGSCCTALVTLKLMDPDLECVDVGSSIYIDKAYRGDTSVLNLLKGNGIRLIL